MQKVDGRFVTMSRTAFLVARHTPACLDDVVLSRQACVGDDLCDPED